jgi:prenyltransferase beta subunit
MSAVYWAIMAMALMGRNLKEEMELDALVDWVLECQHSNGG